MLACLADLTCFRPSMQVPERLQSIFESNFDLLLSIFNPGGHLDITYCDDEMRCGRDDKGNVFVLERLTGTGQEA